MGRPITGSTTVTIALRQKTLDRIDRAAKQAGLTRSGYILQWVPEHHIPNSTTGDKPADNGNR